VPDLRIRQRQCAPEGPTAAEVIDAFKNVPPDASLPERAAPRGGLRPALADRSLLRYEQAARQEIGIPLGNLGTRLSWTIGSTGSLHAPPEFQLVLGNALCRLNGGILRRADSRNFFEARRQRISSTSYQTRGKRIEERSVG
jgi:hypothetical protein